MARVAEGALRREYALKETTFNTYLDIDGANAVGLVEPMKLEPEKAQEEINEGSSTPDLTALVPGKETNKWSAAAVIKPSGGSDTPPDIGPFLEAALGVETIAGSVEYTLSNTVRNSLKLVQHVPDALYQAAAGAWCEKMEIDAPANTAPKFSFSGGYARHIWGYGCRVGAGGALALATTVPIEVLDEAHSLSPDAIVSIGTNLGHRVLTVDLDNDEITISPALTADVNAADAVIPYTPDPVVSGSMLGGVQHALTIGGRTLGFIGAKMSLDTGIHGLDKEASELRATGIAGSRRGVTGSIQCYFFDQGEGARLLGRAFASKDYVINLRLGPNTSLARMSINIENARIMVKPIEIPDAEESLLTLDFVAKKSNLTITFD